MLFGFIFLDSDEDPLPPKIRYMHASTVKLLWVTSVIIQAN